MSPVLNTLENLLLSLVNKLYVAVNKLTVTIINRHTKSGRILTPKNKVKLPSVITSDRWQVFAQNKIDARTKKEKTKFEAKVKKSKKSEPIKQNKTQKKKKMDTKELDDTQEWFCRLCQTHTKMDMIQCIKCKVWYHTKCADVLPNEITFNCIYCNVEFD